jgi:hypothetical protein
MKEMVGHKARGVGQKPLVKWGTKPSQIRSKERLLKCRYSVLPTRLRNEIMAVYQYQPRASIARVNCLSPS